MRQEGSFHALAWAGWAGAALVTVHLAPNPAYVAVVVAVALLVAESHRQEGRMGGLLPVLVGIAAVFVLVRIVLTGLTTSTGLPDVIMTLPSYTLPRILGGFTVGGTVHATVVLSSAVEGLVIVGVIAAFAAFNAVVSHGELVRSLPRAFHEVGLVVTVALAFVPSTISAIQTVREADRARTGGRVVGGGGPARHPPPGGAAPGRPPPPPARAPPHPPPPPPIVAQQ
jgi:energy-coupling factor transport system permease protein